MKFKTFNLLVLIVCVTQVSGKLCSKSVANRRTRNVVRYQSRIVTSRNWVGWIQTKWESHPYYALEYYTENQIIYDCCFGYTKVNGNCEPICYSCSLNSYCAEPYICKCKEGYKSDANSWRICNPYCEQKCSEHSYCSAPNICTCKSGYIFNKNETECKPICKNDCPENGHCLKPNVCECKKGYKLVHSLLDTKCDPICEKSCPSDAYCVKPNQCQCSSGYQLINGICTPQCEPECGQNSSCIKPNQCFCNIGYKPSSEKNTCKPDCSLGCPAYSSCVDVEVCKCNEGYIMNDNGTQCLAHCSSGCPAHSVCYRPGECQCDEGYRLKRLSEQNQTIECEPICPENCLPYGKCQANGCECYPGYASQTEPIDFKKSLCQPKCSKNCTNGFCFSPEVCVCSPGYLMGSNNTCEPTCSMGCINSRCVEPEICKCLPGYRFSLGSVNKCEPICENGCINGDCMAPNLCLCWHQYEPKADFSDFLEQQKYINECTPTCEPNCTNGNCTSPNVCSCIDGYQQSLDNITECLPICENCVNGDCVAPYECNCWTGYNLTEVNGKMLCTFEETITEKEKTHETSTSDDEIFLEQSTTKEENETKEFNVDSVENAFDLPGKLCNEQCKCWQLDNQTNSLNSLHCANICIDNSDQPCLDLSNCFCQLNNLTLSCYSKNLEMAFEYEANQPTIYHCFVQNKVQESSMAKHTKFENNNEKKKFPWIIMLSSIIASCLSGVLVYMVWLRLQKQNVTGSTVSLNGGL